MKTCVFTTEACIRSAAEQILSHLENKADASLAADAGDEALRVLRCTAELAKERGIPLREARVFAVCEFAHMDPRDPNSARQRLLQAFFADADADEEKLRVPDAEEPEAFDALIGDAGGIELAVLSLGENARVGFNEPATQFDTHTHIQKLTDRTRRELAPLFGGEDAVPQHGVTMGFCELCAAREIIVTAFGEEKSKALYHMLYARDDSVYPAAFLQIPANVTVYADPAAAKQLGEKSFDAVMFNGD